MYLVGTQRFRFIFRGEGDSLEISVVVPAYNVERELIIRCIDSLLEQSFNDFEIIIVNDGSKKEYADILVDIQNRSPHVKVINQENGGVSSARNTGTKYSSGNYICYVDADDMVVPSYLSKSYQIAKENDADVVLGGNSYIDRGKKYKDRDLKTTLYTEEGIESLKKYMVGSQMLYFDDDVFVGQGPWNRLIKIDLAKKINFNTNLKIGEDIVWNFELLKNSKRVCVVDSCWYLYYVNPLSASRKYRDDAIEQSMNSLVEIKKYINLLDDQQYKAYCSRCLSDLKRIYYTYLVFTQNRKSVSKKLLCNKPWSEAKSIRYLKLCLPKQRIIALLYKLNLLFVYYEIKDFFKATAINKKGVEYD